MRIYADHISKIYRLPIFQVVECVEKPLLVIIRQQTLVGKGYFWVTSRKVLTGHALSSEVFSAPKTFCYLSLWIFIVQKHGNIIKKS